MFLQEREVFVILHSIVRLVSFVCRCALIRYCYERGYCRPECAKCAEVCPTDAIHLTSLAEKSAIQIGHAVWIAQNCIVNTDKVSCGNCARHCPTGAIQMIPKDENDERCIGCGACENLCPARPFSAIYVEGHEMHRVI